MLDELPCFASPGYGAKTYAALYSPAAFHCSLTNEVMNLSAILASEELYLHLQSQVCLEEVEDSNASSEMSSRQTTNRWLCSLLLNNSLSTIYYEDVLKLIKE
jgi:hypothetical protein